MNREQGMSNSFNDRQQTRIEAVFESLGQANFQPSTNKALPMPEPAASEIYRQTRRIIEEIAHSPDQLLGTIQANYHRLKEGDIDSVFPDQRASAWLRAMHMLTEVASRLYEQNPYEFSRLEEVANSLHLIDDYIKKHRHCPPEMRKSKLN